MSHGIGIEKQISLVKQQLQPADYLDQLMSFKYNIDHNRNSQLWSIDSFSGLSRCPYTSRCPWQSCNLVFKQQCYIRNIFAQFLLLAADAAILGLPCVPHRPIPSKCSAHHCRLQLHGERQLLVFSIFLSLSLNSAHHCLGCLY